MQLRRRPQGVIIRMDILKAVKERRSIRDFQKKKIPDELLDKLMEALIWAARVSKKEAVEVIE
jgi:nitroreductase